MIVKIYNIKDVINSGCYENRITTHKVTDLLRHEVGAREAWIALDFETKEYKIQSKNPNTKLRIFQFLQKTKFQPLKHFQKTYVTGHYISFTVKDK